MVSTAPFVGREQEQQRLRDAFDSARDGRGGVAMISGNPGIGKTRLARQLESYALEGGARVIWGRAHEAEGAPAYWPWTQALRSLLDVAEDGELRGWLGSGAGEVALLVPELRRRLPDLPEPAPTDDPSEARFRLFDAVTRFVGEAASATPMVIVLDDLHWADQSTLQLLVHATPELARAKVLMVGTYRDVELGRQHPLEQALADISRSERWQTIDLHGLSEPDVASYIHVVSAAEPSAETVNTIYRETEGNAFFLQEVVALMVQEGTLESGEVRIPQSVRAVIGRRLGALSERCNELLRTAAVMGREFTDLALIRLNPEAASETQELIESALSAGVVEEMARAGEYRFAHALIQETLLHELRTPQRVRLHGRIAEALEEAGSNRIEEQATQLAMHYAESSVLGNDYAEKAIRYSLLAGEQAEQRLAWSEATRLYERAATTFDDAPDLETDIDRAELYASLARVAAAAGEYRLCWQAIQTAADEYRERGDGAGIARLFPRFPRATWLPSQRSAALLLEASDLIGEGRDVELEVLSRMTATLLNGVHRAFVTDPEAVQLIDRLRRRTAAGDPGEAEELDLLRIEAYEALRRGDLSTFIENHKRIPNGNVGWQLAGELDGAREAAAAQLQNPSLGLGARANRATNLMGVALFRADYEEFERLLDTYEPVSTYRFDLLRAIHALEQGDVDRAVRSLPDPTTLGNDRPYLLGGAHGVRCAVFWLAGRHGDAATEFQQSLDAAEAAGARGLRAGAGLSPADESIVALAPYMFEAAAAHLANEEERAAIEVIVRSQPGLTAGRTSSWPWCAQRVYGEWALVLGMDEDAERLFADALEWCERERGPIEAGRCHQGLAEVAVRKGELAEAGERLDAAAALFERHGAKLYLDQVRARREELAAPGAGPASYPLGLSEREVEVLRLMADGKTNAAIAEELVIAPATVASHVRSILTKTNTANRTAAGLWAARQGLTGEAGKE